MKKVYIGAVITVLLLVAINIVKGSLDILDYKFFYLKSEIDVVFELLGAEGRSRYTIINILDFFFIAAFTYTLIDMYKVFFEKDNLYKSLLWVPIAFCIADYTETGIIFYLNKIYPETIESLKTVLMIATPVKWFFVLSSLLVIVNGYLLQIYLKRTGSN